MSYLGIRGIGIFGYGQNGAVTITAAMGVVDLVDDKFYTNLTVEVGATLTTSNSRIFCTGELTNNGTISQDGISATSSTGAAVSPTQSPTAQILGPPGIGGNGGTAAGSQGGASLVLFGGGGGTGGTAGANAGGAGGNVGTITAAEGGNGTSSPPFLFTYPYSTMCTKISSSVSQVKITPGAGGGGGAASGSGTGGGGGSGAGFIFVCARVVRGNGVFGAVGGNGFSPASGVAGGGGGGGGGAVIIQSSQDTTLTSTVTYNLAGGTGGTGFGGGLNGNNGTTGNTNLFVNGL